MASFFKLVFCYFLLVILSSSLIHARESKFFSKFTHYSITKSPKKSSFSPIEAPAPTPSLALAPTPAQAPAPSPEAIYPQSIEKETTTQNELLNEEFDGNTYQKEYQNSNGYTGNYNYNNGVKFASESHETGNQKNYDTNAYTGSYNINGYELTSVGYENGNDQNSKNSYTSNYINNDAYGTDQRQGMSDTRYMEGGKYYYYVKNENNYYPANGYESGKVSAQNQARYGNSEKQIEFDTVEFENQELYDDEPPEESLP